MNLGNKLSGIKCLEHLAFSRSISNEIFYYTIDNIKNHLTVVEMINFNFNRCMSYENW